MRLVVANTGSRSGNSYALIADGGEILILDAGCRYKDILRAIDYRIGDVAGVLVTHEHQDHLRSFKDFAAGGIRIGGCPELAEKVGSVYGGRIQALPELRTSRIGRFSVRPFYVPHTTMGEGGLTGCPNYGYMIRHPEMGRLIYMTDLEYCPYNFRSQHPQHLLIECNYQTEYTDREQANFRHRLKGHCSLDTCRGIVEANRTPDLRTVTLCHLSDGAADPQEVRDEIKKAAGSAAEVNVARPGLTVELREFPF